MTDRDTQITQFITDCGWSDAQVASLAGDASNRRYLRLMRVPDQRAVLMDAPPTKGEDVRSFIQIAEHLSGLGLSAPRILGRNEALGFLLLEDLGDALFARVLGQDPAMENSLYSAATDVLVTLHTQRPPTGLAAYDPPLMADLAALAFDWYLKGFTGDAAADTRTAFTETFSALLTDQAGTSDVLIQRDYHAENLLWLPDRTDTARVGLLDFQDAMTGHRAYDLVSLLQDARRDVSPQTEAAMLARYTQSAGLEPKAFDDAYHLLGVQRNLRIIGVFARLCIRDGKAHYVDLIPRVWGHLIRDLDHPVAAPVRDMLLQTLPEPSLTHLKTLKDKCATIQHP